MKAIKKQNESTHWTIKVKSPGYKFHPMGCTHTMPNKKFLEELTDGMAALTLSPERMAGIVKELKTKRKAVFGNDVVCVVIKEEKVKTK